MPLTQVSPGMLDSTAQYYSFKNRIINGACAIDQRNNGASVNLVSSGNTYVVDRFFGFAAQNSRLTAQQNAGSVTPPAGFTNYLGATSSATWTAGASESFLLGQFIEGFNFADMRWGTANAASVTISFWVRSSLTGTFSGAVGNGAADRSYAFSFSISAANTWEQKSITIAGDTSGTWVGATNGLGLRMYFDLGSGSSNRTTAGSWVSGFFVGATGANSLGSASGATFYITGVQLEKGSTATSFDYRPYTTETQLCYRYYFRAVQYSTYSPIGVGRAWSSTNGNSPFYLPVVMRSNQTITFSSLSHFDIVTLGNPTAIQNDGAGGNNVKVGWARTTGISSGTLYQFEFGNTTSGWLGFDAEL